MTNKERALLIAERVHSNQTYDIYPYMYHIKAVMNIAEQLGYDESIITGAILHDSMEDGDLSYNDIQKAFGTEIAEIVYAVTDELGRNRKERKDKTYPKIKSNWKATVVKICDRIANITHSKQYNEKLFKMYKKESQNFYDSLYTDNIETQKAWNFLIKILE